MKSQISFAYDMQRLGSQSQFDPVDEQILQRNC